MGNCTGSGEKEGSKGREGARPIGPAADDQMGPAHAQEPEQPAKQPAEQPAGDREMVFDVVRNDTPSCQQDAAAAEAARKKAEKDAAAKAAAQKKAQEEAAAKAEDERLVAAKAEE